MLRTCMYRDSVSTRQSEPGPRSAAQRVGVEGRLKITSGKRGALISRFDRDRTVAAAWPAGGAGLEEARGRAVRVCMAVHVRLCQCGVSGAHQTIVASSTILAQAVGSAALRLIASLRLNETCFSVI